jgi:hypothetical protein
MYMRSVSVSHSGLPSVIPQGYVDNGNIHNQQNDQE